MVRHDFPTTNNEAKYETLVAGLDLTKVAGAMSVVIHCDSQVVTNQVNDDYKCKSERMKKYLEQVRKRVEDLQAKIIQIRCISRAHNHPWQGTFLYSVFAIDRCHQCAGNRF